MDYRITVNQSFEGFIKSCMEVNSKIYSPWIRFSTFLAGITVFVVAFSILIFFSEIFLPKLLYVKLGLVVLTFYLTNKLWMKVLCPKLSGFLIRFAKVDLHSTLVSTYTFSDEGITLDEPNRRTELDWRGVSDIIEMEDKVAIFCSPLSYIITIDAFKTDEEFQSFVANCKLRIEEEKDKHHGQT